MGCKVTAPPIHPQRMFMHAAESGWKEAERLFHCGCRHGLPRLDPEADASAIQLVGYQTTLEEIGELFHQVYSLRRLPGSLPYRPEQE